MHADLKGSLENINKDWKTFVHRGKPMEKIEVIKVLQFGIMKGYKSTSDLKDEEVDAIINLNRASPNIQMGKNIKALRKKMKLNQTELSTLLELQSKSSIWAFESGECYPSLENIVRLSKIFNVTIDDLTLKKLW